MFTPSSTRRNWKGAVALLMTPCLIPWTLATGQRTSPTTSLSRLQTSSPVGPLVTFGGLVAAATLADGAMRGFSQAHRGSLGNNLASIGNALGDPRFVLPALGLAGVTGALFGKSDAAGSFLQAGKAVIVAGTISQLLKFSIGRLRPEPSGGVTGLYHPFSHGDGLTSFPSGHTTVAFALATVLADRSRNPWAAGLAYAGAAMTGFGRINHDRHWFSDVMAGALIGQLTARALGSSPPGISRTTGRLGLVMAGALGGQLAAKAIGSSRVRVGGTPGGIGLSLSF